MEVVGEEEEEVEVVEEQEEGWERRGERRPSRSSSRGLMCMRISTISRAQFVT
jgi:hypothetical protein